MEDTFEHGNVRGFIECGKFLSLLRNYSEEKKILPGGTVPFFTSLYAGFVLASG